MAARPASPSPPHRVPPPRVRGVLPRGHGLLPGGPLLLRAPQGHTVLPLPGQGQLQEVQLQLNLQGTLVNLSKGKGMSHASPGHG